MLDVRVDAKGFARSVISIGKHMCLKNARIGHRQPDPGGVEDCSHGWSAAKPVVGAARTRSAPEGRWNL
jgi:hypothetical protein